MDEPKIIFHAGTHKTGTTSIQAALANNREQLSRHGIVYPGGWRNQENHLKYVQYASEGNLREKFDLWQFRRAISRASGQGNRVLVSAESAYRAGTRQDLPSDDPNWWHGHTKLLAAVKRGFSRAPVKALLYLRRPEKLAISVYKEAAARRRSGPIAPLPKLLSSRRYLFDYPRQIAAFTDVFDALETRHYETEVKADGGLVGGFFAHLGLSEPEVVADPLRQSMTDAGVHWLSEHAKSDDRTAYRRRLLFVFHSRDESLKDEEGSSLWPSHEAYSTFIERHLPSYELDYFAQPPSPPAQYAAWSEAKQADVDRAYGAWETKYKDAIDARMASSALFFRPFDPEASLKA